MRLRRNSTSHLDGKVVIIDANRPLIEQQKELKRIDWRIVKRLLRLLYYSSEVKKTNVAMGCRLGYNNCLLYLKWLGTMDLIKSEIDKHGFELISMSEWGRSFYTNKLK